MTLIAGFTTGGIPTLIGDVIASFSAEGTPIRLPTVGDSSEVFPPGSEVTLHFVQKLVDINPHLLIAYSGHTLAASIVARELRELCAGERVSHEELADYLASLECSEDEMIRELSLIGIQIDDKDVEHLFVRKAMQMHGLSDGTDAFYEGSGGGHFSATLRGSNTAFARIEGPPWFAAMSRAHAMQAAGLLREVWTRPGSDDRTENPIACLYGGGYELAMVIETEAAQRAVRKVGDTVLAFWEVRIAESGRIDVLQPSLFLRRSYSGRNLLLRWGRPGKWRRERTALIPEDTQECAVVPPVDERGRPQELGRDLWPKFSAPYEGHAVLITSPSGYRNCVGWLSFQRSVLRRAFAFTDLPDGSVHVAIATSASIRIQQYVEQLLAIGVLGQEEGFEGTT